MIGPSDSYVNSAQTPAQWADWDARIDKEMAERAYAEKRRAYEERLAAALATKARGGAPPPNPWRLSDNDIDFEGLLPTLPNDSHLARESALVAGLCEKRESDYVEHCLNTAGHILPVKVFQDSLRRRFVRFDQSTRLNLALIEGGARKPEPRRNAPAICTLVTRQHIPLPVLARVNFFPEQAAARRSSMLKEVETYAARNPLARMSTFTRGQRVPLPMLREETGHFTRKLSRLNAEPWFRHYAEIVFRAVEFGTLKLSALSAEWTAHIHAHTILKPHRYHHPKKWRKFCGKVARYMGAHWDCGRPIEDAREVVKYPVKPADLEHVLAVGGVAPICELYRQTLGMRMVETLGRLRSQRQSVKNTKRKRLKERNAEGEWLPVTRRCWNSQGRSRTKAAIRAARAVQEKKAELRAGLQMLAGRCELPEETPLAPKMINRIVARLAPAPFATRVYEPAVFVWNFTGDWEAITGHKCVARVVAAVTPQVSRALKAAQREDGEAGHHRPHQSHNCPAAEVGLGLVNAPPDPFRRHLEAVSA